VGKNFQQSVFENFSKRKGRKLIVEIFLEIFMRKEDKVGIF